MEFRQIKSPRRKTMTLQVSRTGEIIVRTPVNVSEEIIRRFIEKHENWIRQKVNAARQNPVPQFKEDELFYYLGEQYPLRFGDSGSHSIKFDNAFIIAEELQEKAEELLLTWFQRQALKYLNQRTPELAAGHGLKYRKLRLNDASTNWGSCSSLGYLNFNWRLIQCPPPVIDYIIVHELAHLTEMNHSSRFWELVEQMYPEYKQYKSWLRRNSIRNKFL